MPDPNKDEGRVQPGGGSGGQGADPGGSGKLGQEGKSGGLSLEDAVKSLGEKGFKPEDVVNLAANMQKTAEESKQYKAAAEEADSLKEHVSLLRAANPGYTGTDSELLRDYIAQEGLGKTKPDPDDGNGNGDDGSNGGTGKEPPAVDKQIQSAEFRMELKTAMRSDRAIFKQMNPKITDEEMKSLDQEVIQTLSLNPRITPDNLYVKAQSKYETYAQKRHQELKAAEEAERAGKGDSLNSPGGGGPIKAPATKVAAGSRDASTVKIFSDDKDVVAT